MFGYMNKMAAIDKIVAGTWKDVKLIERALAGEPNYRRLLEDIRRVA